MRKMMFFIILILLVFVLSSCDYPEKSFQALQRDYIPKVVTRNFQLEKGVYAPFVWTSDHEAIVIDGNDAIVNQQAEDVIVYITATINQRSESFEIKVLKIGSPLSSREQAEDITAYLNETYPEIDGGLLELPNEMNGICIQYHLDLLQSSYGYKLGQDKTYLSSSFRAFGNNISIPITFYDDIEMKNENRVYSNYLSLIAKPLSDDDPFLLAVQEINLNNYQFSNNLSYQFEITNLKVGDTIEFATSNTFEVKLTFNRDEYFLQLAPNKYEIVQKFRDKTSELGRLTLTIDGVSKTIFVHLYM